MSYYTGDFYPAGRGDPFWGALLGVAKKVGGALLGGIRGGGGPKQLPEAIGTLATRGGKIVQAVKSGIVKHPVLSAAGAAGAIGVLGTAGVERMLAGAGACPKGFHISKSKHAKSFGACVRNRRMNVANGRALSRAVRRLHHFARKYRKVVGFVSPRKPKGRMYFKKRKRAA
jgi:hypothetical protein